MYVVDNGCMRFELSCILPMYVVVLLFSFFPIPGGGGAVAQKLKGICSYVRAYEYCTSASHNYLVVYDLHSF